MLIVWWREGLGFVKCGFKEIGDQIWLLFEEVEKVKAIWWSVEKIEKKKGDNKGKSTYNIVENKAKAANLNSISPVQ